jgi:hypothetical protein
MIPGRYHGGDRDVNAGHWSARADKRWVFYAQNRLLEFLVEPWVLEDDARLGEAINRMGGLARDGFAAEARQAMRAHAAWSEARLLEAL